MLTIYLLSLLVCVFATVVYCITEGFSFYDTDLAMDVVICLIPAINTVMAVMIIVDLAEAILRI